MYSKSASNKNRTFIILLFLVFFIKIKNVKSENVFNGGQILDSIEIPNMLDSWPNLTSLIISATKDIPPSLYSPQMMDCFRDIAAILSGSKHLQQWAIKMLDASSKVQSGILEGNIVDLGQYDECIKIQREHFKGQHCLANFIVKINSSTELNVPQDVLDGDLTLTSALCIPSTCDSSMVEILVNNQLVKLNQSPYFIDFGINVTGKVNEEDCHTDYSTPLSLAEYVVIAVCILLVALVIVSTIFDIIMRTKGGNRLSSKAHLFLRAFSAPRNFRRLLNTNMTEGSLSCINGARFLCIAWVALGHRYKFTCQQPLVNLLYLPEVLKSWWSMLIVNATLSVDVFFLIGGLLNAYIYMKVPGRKHNWKSTLIDFIHRYLRLTPAYALMIAITATWIYRLGDGPLWDRVVGTASIDCQNQWFPGILYINNYYNTENYCMMQSWYLAADMQMFWLSPILLYPLWRWPKLGLIQGAVLIVLSILTPFYVAYDEQIKTPIPLSRNTARVEREMETLYLPTHTKTISYIVGILLGYLLYLIKTNKIKWSLTVWQKVIGWVVAIIFMGGALLGAHPLFQVDHPYNRWESSLYIGFYRFFWALGVGWLFLACCTGNGGILTNILNCKPFIVLGRLTYGIYLTHVAVIIQKLGSARQPTFLNHYDQIQQFLGEFLITILCALALTLTLESPFLVIEKILIRRRGSAVAPENGVNLSGRTNAIESDDSRRDTNSHLQRTA